MSSWRICIFLSLPANIQSPNFLPFSKARQCVRRDQMWDPKRVSCISYSFFIQLCWEKIYSWQSMMKKKGKGKCPIKRCGSRVIIIYLMNEMKEYIWEQFFISETPWSMRKTDLLAQKNQELKLFTSTTYNCSISKVILYGTLQLLLGRSNFVRC